MSRTVFFFLSILLVVAWTGQAANGLGIVESEGGNYTVIDGEFYEPGYDGHDLPALVEVDVNASRRLTWKKWKKIPTSKTVKTIKAPNKAFCPNANGISYYSKKHWICKKNLNDVNCGGRARPVHFWGCGCACVAFWRQGVPKNRKPSCPKKKKAWYVPYDYQVCKRLGFKCGKDKKKFRSKGCGCGCAKPNPAPQPTPKPSPKPTPAATAKPTSKPTAKPSAMRRVLMYDDDDGMNDIISIDSSAVDAEGNQPII
mmetsp:Transcript_13901/g.20019  ORF Transcript_13901/g.20019 Transcript_13901/m.20019 type:complete len:256 (-) Transcript_13901:144-911(-)|eukprot:CAMPEP_0202459138 /NCGR_PEP_ID=MMETSP1360-20130828/31957_1 /ASSEMBLY_ACC=CAM_ASM_000848 /TAXON_ID=515479 /ORGANISM="Licmophora paradoxa, Strain CCMP2313" /LENGTH=255 /DNA_ID=CAMNT_0049080027 /DNA_START=32 /DNA_END=799 /DNA_ORIENTATION=-